jgi:hypothetical protein
LRLFLALTGRERFQLIDDWIHSMCQFHDLTVARIDPSQVSALLKRLSDWNSTQRRKR